MNVEERRLPNSNVTGCFFHLSSNIRKRIQSTGLQDRYNNDDGFALNLRMISAIAFVPPDDVIESFDILTDELRRQFGDALEDLVQYFEDTTLVVEDTTLVVFEGIYRGELQFSPERYGTCFIVVMKNFHAQITV